MPLCRLLQFVHVDVHTASQGFKVVPTFQHGNQPLLATGGSDLLDHLRQASISFFGDLHVSKRIGIVSVEAGGDQDAVWSVLESAWQELLLKGSNISCVSSPCWQWDVQREAFALTVSGFRGRSSARVKRVLPLHCPGI